MDMTHHFSSASMVSKRRSNKPIVEKKRRERINKSLEELKKLVLQNLQKDTEEFEKMEKADILEMAVNHLKTLRKTHLHPDVRAMGQVQSLSKYRTGYNECATEVMRYLNQSPVLSSNPSVKSRLVDHVSTCVQRVNITPAVPRTAPVSTYTPSAAFSGNSPHPLHRAPSATPHASLPGSSGALSSFTPVRKSPAEAFEAPQFDYSSSSLDTSISSAGSCVSPIDFRMNLMMSSFPSRVQSPSGSQYSAATASRSSTPTQPRDNSPAQPSPAFLAALDIEEIRAKYESVWRPW